MTLANNLLKQFTKNDVVFFLVMSYVVGSLVTVIFSPIIGVVAFVVGVPIMITFGITYETKHPDNVNAQRSRS